MIANGSGYRYPRGSFNKTFEVCFAAPDRALRNLRRDAGDSSIFSQISAIPIRRQQPLADALSLMSRVQASFTQTAYGLSAFKHLGLAWLFVAGSPSQPRTNQKPAADINGDSGDIPGRGVRMVLMFLSPNKVPQGEKVELSCCGA